MKHKTAKKDVIVVSLRIPTDLYEAILSRVAIDTEDLDFSKFARRAIRHEFENSTAISPVNQPRRQA
jgi:hypothetical protein